MFTLSVHFPLLLPNFPHILGSLSVYNSLISRGMCPNCCIFFSDFLAFIVMAAEITVSALSH